MDFPGEKLVIKLWETLAEKGIGALLTPWQTKREGLARIEVHRDELLMLAQAETDAADHGISFELLFQMQEMGIVSGVEALALQTTYKSSVEGRFIRALPSNGKALIVEHDDPLKPLQLEIYKLTSVGMQILGLGTFESDIDYLTLVGKQIAAQGFKVQLCDWRQVSENEGRYFNAEPIDA